MKQFSDILYIFFYTMICLLITNKTVCMEEGISSKSDWESFCSITNGNYSGISENTIINNSNSIHFDFDVEHGEVINEIPLNELIEIVKQNAIQIKEYCYGSYGLTVQIYSNIALYCIQRAIHMTEDSYAYVRKVMKNMHCKEDRNKAYESDKEARLLLQIAQKYIFLASKQRAEPFAELL